MSVTPALTGLQTAAQDAGLDTSRESFRLLDLPDAWVVVMVLVPAALAISALAYWREPISRRARGWLGGLRFLSILLLMTVLARPVRVRHQESVQPAEVAVLLDDSASMRRMDAYGGDPDLRSALQSLAGRAPQDVARLELAQAALSSAFLERVEERGYRIRTYRFSESLAPLTDPAEADARGHRTHLGDALRQTFSTTRGGNLTDVVVLSDGRSNGGTPAVDAALGARASGLPVHTVTVGDARPEQNLVAELVESPESVLEGDEVAIRARVLARGVSGVGTTRIVLEEVGPSGLEEDTRVVAEESVPLSEAGERVVLVAPPGSGSVVRRERRFRVLVPPLPDESLLDDNAVEFSVRVSTEKVRVLYVDGYPRYEYRFLKDLLKRADDRISVQCFLLSATHGFPQEASRGLPALTEVPTERRELLDNYDVVILGDVNPYAIAPDPAQGEEFVASLIEFVERGGGLALIAGETDNPRSVAGTDLAKLYPVELDTSGSLNLEYDTRVKMNPVLEDPVSPHEIVRLEPNAEVNRRLWEEKDGLTGFYWFHPVVDAKPGSQVLLRHPSHAGPHGRYPLLVLGYYPSGRTMFLAIDSTYAWQRRYQKLYHERFWRNAVRWLALGRLRGGDRRFLVEPLRASYDLDERVTLEARVLDEDYRPSDAPQQEVFVSSTPGGDGRGEPLALQRVEGREGLFRGSFERDRPGLYRVWIEEGGEHVASAEVEIVLPSLENADPTPDPETMASIASITGGQNLHVARMSALLTEFPGGEERREPISSQLKDAWDHWGTLLLALLLLSTEWVLRKRVELI